MSRQLQTQQELLQSHFRLMIIYVVLSCAYLVVMLISSFATHDHVITKVEYIKVTPAPIVTPRVLPSTASRSRVIDAAMDIPRPHRVSPASRPRATVTGLSAFQVWQASAALHQVEYCESTMDSQATNGQYSGILQMDADFWATYGGLAYASGPLGATKEQQEHVGYLGYLARGWQPWTCRRAIR